MSTQSYTASSQATDQQVTGWQPTGRHAARPSRTRRLVLAVGVALAATGAALTVALWPASHGATPATTGTSTSVPAVPSRPVVNPAVPSRPVVNPAVPARPAANPAVPARPAANPAVPARPAANPAVPSQPAANPAVPATPGTHGNGASAG
jgi:hypothetical protein